MISDEDIRDLTGISPDNTEKTLRALLALSAKIHSKYYIMDDETLFLGGINVEDKENGADMQGRAYQDYMVRIDGKEAVQSFLSQKEGGMVETNGYFFGFNRKKPRRFDMEKLYLENNREACSPLLGRIRTSG